MRGPLGETMAVTPADRCQKRDRAHRRPDRVCRAAKGDPGPRTPRPQPSREPASAKPETPGTRPPPASRPPRSPRQRGERPGRRLASATASTTVAPPARGHRAGAVSAARRSCAYAPGGVCARGGGARRRAGRRPSRSRASAKASAAGATKASGVQPMCSRVRDEVHHGPFSPAPRGAREPRRGCPRPGRSPRSPRARRDARPGSAPRADLGARFVAGAPADPDHASPAQAPVSPMASATMAASPR